MTNVGQAFRETSNMPPRIFLGIAAVIYALSTALGPDLAGQTGASAYQALSLSSGLRWSLVLLFSADAFFIWWRIFDATPRKWWALFTNILTFSLWFSITGATIFAYKAVLPDSVGEIMVTLASIYVLTRTDLTWRDQRSA